MMDQQAQAPPLGEQLPGVYAVPPEGQMVCQLPDWACPEDEAASNMVYLVTFPALVGQQQEVVAEARLRDPDTLSREDIKSAVLDAVTNPSPLGRGRRRSQPVEIVKGAVFQEKHANDKKHFHVAMKLSPHSRWVGFKLALRSRHSLASHWSSIHTMFWSAVRYCHFTTVSKMVVDEAPLSWSRVALL